MHSDRNNEGGAGPIEQPLTWDDADVADPERQGFLSLQEPDAHFTDTCSQFARCHFLYASCCESTSSLHQ